ncbi:hypothetical protein KPH14_012897 [Odynerus spinipes]|uniref:Uncharacterized protein n=1 Tax=Odynerus spinipes TaxID=1348599 RepID=A0AAD9RGU8_9HYME|nr:hypothetical protein KPH14_012897 [Odynerus spinipes]
MKNTLSNTSVDEWLFGVDLEEKIKSAKNLERTTKDLKSTAKPLQQRNQKNPKNLKGPPRQMQYKNRTAMASGQRESFYKTPDAKKRSGYKEPARQFGKRR